MDDLCGDCYNSCVSFVKLLMTKDESVLTCAVFDLHLYGHTTDLLQLNTESTRLF